ncbi:Aromatic/aminoadipate aminotransferase 1 [Ceratocystis pirilliformis]|uniref:Aromatic/aminoadipate aminotransferase 1 n=1 Tax=Ceratocystis pirilliformis TaxID=259994 RepID=A0ABR3ZCI3_9PEZI
MTAHSSADTTTTQYSDALQAIKARRAAANHPKAGIAAYSESDYFKGPQTGKPMAKRWDHYLSAESKHRQPCMLKKAAQHLKKPDIISLGGGLPSSEYFPFSEMKLRVNMPDAFTETGPSSQTTMGKHDMSVLDAEYDLAIALNYTQASGSFQFMRWITEHTELLYNPPYADWGCSETIGSTSALEIALRMLCDKNRKDTIITEEFSFASAIETMTPMGLAIAGAKVDGEGLDSESLDEILSSWDEQARGSRKPHVLYTVPSGQNPTGATQSLERRLAVYSVCQKHDVFILEDEPYYFLQMPAYKTKAERDSTPTSSPWSLDAFLSSLVPTFVSIDIDGRVMRMDSFSKVLAPGSRMGWITAPAQIIERYIRHAEVATQAPSGFSQAALYKLLDETWGHETYLKWLQHIQHEYTHRRNVLLDACEEFMPKSVTSWVPPSAGMFLWIKVDHTQHPEIGKRSLEEIEESIFLDCVDNGVLVASGSWFHAETPKPLPGLYFRATFAAASEERMSMAVKRLSEAIKKSFKL